MVASFGVGVQLARVLGVAGYGYYGLAFAVITIAGIPGEMGLPRLVTREVAAAGARNDMPVLFGVLRWADSMAWRISGFMAAAVLVAGLIIAEGHPTGLVTAILLGVPVIPLLALARIRGGALQGLHYVVLGQVPDVLLRPLLLSILVLLVTTAGVALGPAGAMGLNSLGACAVFVFAQFWLKRRLPHDRPSEVARGGRRWLASSIPMALTDGMRVLQSEVSILLLGLLAAPPDVGLFRIASVTSFTAAMPVSVINFVAFPLIAKLFTQNDTKNLQKALTHLAQAQFAGVVLLCLPLLFAAEPLLNLVFGAGYVPAANALRILVVAQIICAGLGASVALLNMTGHEQRVTRAMAIALVLNFAAVAILSTLWGIVGAAIGVGSALVCWNVQTWLDSRRFLRIETSVIGARRPADVAVGAKPNLFIVGAPKCGTTAWFRYLDTHPEIFISEVKETSFFADDLPGMQWVKSLAGYERLFLRGRNAKVVGDASAAHLFSKVAARNIARYNPDAKILIFLRKQEDYLPALHHHFLSRFEECIEDFETAWRLSGKRPKDTLLKSFTEPRLLHYAAIGRFHEQVERFYAVFPADQIRVIRFEDWTKNPRGTYLAILEFLGLEDDGRTDFPRINEAKWFRVKWIGRLIMQPPAAAEWVASILRKVTRRNALGLAEWASNMFATKGYRTQVSPELREEIRRHYEDDNRMLDELLASYPRVST